jgi:curved DNA-binding protein CbpA
VVVDYGRTLETTKDYYAIIGVLPSIDDAALTAACRALLKKYHPDVNKGQNSDGRAAEIIEAYRVLGSADQRKAYDRARSGAEFETHKYEDTWSARKEDAWSAKHEAWWSERQEELRSEKAREKPSMARTMLTMWLLSFAIRSLIVASIFAFIAAGLGPGGTLFTDTFKSLKALSQLGNVNIKFPFGGDS